jgi:serine/threonine protein kinase
MKDGKFLKTSCGSLKYAAPEILRGREYVGTQVDVWSCGVILFTMLTGNMPFDDDVMSRLIKKITEAKFTIPKYVSP